MPVYSVHEPPLKRRASRRGPENFVFVRDGFYFWAFLFGPLWLFWQKLWLSLFLYIVVVGALLAGLHFAGVGAGGRFSVLALIALLLGLEAGTLLRWTLRRRKWRDLGVVSADNVEGAERRFFDAWTSESFQGAPAPRAPAAAAPVPTPTIARRPTVGGNDVVGLFPEPGAPR